jgi:hypothetical protein
MPPTVNHPTLKPPTAASSRSARYSRSHPPLATTIDLVIDVVHIVSAGIPPSNQRKK